MQNDTSKIVDHVKVHRLSCLELKKTIDKITPILKEIDSARPRCVSGLQALCNLQVSMDEIMLLRWQCSESSKLYLAITGDKIVRRCEGIRHSLESCLSHIQTMVPSSLAAKISRIVDDLKVATFTVESSEDEAGKILLALLYQGIASSGSSNAEEVKAFKSAALRLQITSPVAVLVEKKSIRKLLGEIQDNSRTKKKILNYFLYLIRKYGRSSVTHEKMSTTILAAQLINHPTESQLQGDDFGLVEPPEEFKCPLSRRLMSDPVTIASGQTFERAWIQKWFKEGHKTCPKTCMELVALSMAPNVELKDLISKWCFENDIIYFDPCLHSTRPLLGKDISSVSTSSFGSSLGRASSQLTNVSFQSSNTNDDIDLADADAEDKFGPNLLLNKVHLQGFQSLPLSEGHGTTLSILGKLSELPWASRRKAVEDVKNQLKETEGSRSTLSASDIQQLIRYLKDANGLHDAAASRDGAELILIFLRESRSEVPPSLEDAFFVLSSLLDSEITEEVLSMLEVLSNIGYYQSAVVASGVLSSVLNILENPSSKHHLAAIRVLCNFSSQNDIGQHMIYLDFIPKLVPFLDELILTGYCIRICKNLCRFEEARDELFRSENCVTSIGELLEVGSDEEQELATDVLLSLCYQREEYRELIMQENIISHLVSISVNGSSIGKLNAVELLHLLNNVSNDHSQECTILSSGSAPDFLSSSGDSCGVKKPSPKSSGFFIRKVKKFIKLGRG